MAKKILTAVSFLLVTLLFIFSLFSIVSSVNATYGEDYYTQTHKEYSKFHYFMLYKPQGVVSATTDGKNKTVLDLLKDENVKGF